MCVSKTRPDWIEHYPHSNGWQGGLPSVKLPVVFGSMDTTRSHSARPTFASRRLAAHAQTVYRELGIQLVVDDQPTGGGTDAAFAALQTEAPVLEGMGLQGYGAHSNDAEYVELRSIEPRLYLLTRMIMDVADGTASR